MFCGRAPDSTSVDESSIGHLLLIGDASITHIFVEWGKSRVASPLRLEQQGTLPACARTHTDTPPSFLMCYLENANSHILFT
mmetsp:Transcript_3154/g.12077  ORF Transcript_3154/g.12077 Transcript_3154/m.12077 type:complete len:82 (+) Transcript_3154:283-528(+)